MQLRIPITLGLTLLLGITAALKVEAQRSLFDTPTPKRAVTSSRLLLPFFAVDMSDAQGKTTFFSVRNEITQLRDVRISLFKPDSPQSPFFTETVTLAGKRLLSVDVRSKLTGQTGVVRGYGIFETVSGEAVIQGDFFEVDPEDAFASGSRLVDIDRESEQNDLCSIFTIRLLDGGPFDGTLFTIWLDLDIAPQDTDILSYAVYNEAGVLQFVTDLAANEVAIRKTAAELTEPGPIRAGAIEIQLNNGARGHVSAVMSALGLYSVGLEAVCRD